MATNFGVSTSSPFRRDPVVLPGGIAETHSIPFCRLLRAWCLWCSFREKICYIITLDKRRGRKTWRRKPFLHVISPETELPGEHARFLKTSSVNNRCHSLKEIIERKCSGCICISHRNQCCTQPMNWVLYNFQLNTHAIILQNNQARDSLQTYQSY